MFDVGRKGPAGRKIALICAAAALAALPLACASEDPAQPGEERPSDRDDETRGDDSDDQDDDGDEPEAPAPSGGSKVDGGKPPTTGGKKDAGAPLGEGPSEPGDKAPGQGASSLWCKALPVIQETCQTCHNEALDFGAPMSLKKHADFTAASPKTAGKKVYQTVGERIHDERKPMPPQKKLTAEQLAALDAWIEAGAPAGDDPTCGGAVDAEAPKEPEQVWPPPGCEKTYRVLAGENGGKATVAAGSEPHPQFISDAPWGDQEVQALGFKPVTDNKKVLHHWILYARQGGTFINGWAPGKDASNFKPYPEDVGVWLPKGKQALRLDMHYYNREGTKAEQDASGVEVCTTSKFRKYSATTFSGFAAIPNIPPGMHDMVGKCTVTARQPVYIMSESPHAHELAVYMKLEVQRGGELITLHDAPFNFEEQQVTMFDKPFELKTGDVVTTTCRYKNDTGRTVGFGENTGNEMCFNFVVYYPMGQLSCSRSGGGGRLGGF